MGIKGGQIGSIKKLKAAVKRGGGGGMMMRIKEGEQSVRFLTEPDQWFTYLEHYDEENKFYPCSDDCPGCAAGSRSSQRFLANVLDVETGKVNPLVIPQSLASRVVRKYERLGTLMDRDYTLMREGTGLETEYDLEAEAPTKIRLSKYELLDLAGVLEAQLSLTSGDDDDEDTDDDESPARIRRNASATRKRRPARDDDDDEPPARKAPIKRPGQARKEHETAANAAMAKRTKPAVKAASKGTVRRPSRNR